MEKLGFRSKGEEIIISIPKNFEIVEIDTTDGTIRMKEVHPSLPTKWEDFWEIDGWYVSTDSRVRTGGEVPACSTTKNTWPTKELAEASLALCQLVRYRDAWNEGWVANFIAGSDIKYAVRVIFNKIEVIQAFNESYPMIFKTKDVATKFAETFVDLLEIAKPLL